MKVLSIAIIINNDPIISPILNHILLLGLDTNQFMTCHTLSKNKSLKDVVSAVSFL